LIKTDLTGALSSTSGSFTVFAPTDAAFSAFLSTAGFSSIQDVPNDVLKPILLYHVIGAKVSSSAVSTGYAATISPADDENFLSIFIEKSSGVKINNSAMVTNADVQADNGVIHIIDKVITPLSVGELVAVNPDLSALAGAVVSQNLLNTLKDKTGSFTVFAPNNAGFAKHQSLPSDVTSLLLYHVIGSKVFSTDLTTGYYNTLSKFGQYAVNVKVITSPEVKLNNSAKVIKADIAGTNGVVHIIDDVIFQPSVVAIAQHNPDFSILVQAVIKAELAETLSGSGPFTVFAPTNNAFNALFDRMNIGAGASAMISSVMRMHSLVVSSFAEACQEPAEM
jgi:transforming growth factor-beta-induced protein